MMLIQFHATECRHLQSATCSSILLRHLVLFTFDHSGLRPCIVLSCCFDEELSFSSHLYLVFCCFCKKTPHCNVSVIVINIFFRWAIFWTHKRTPGRRRRPPGRPPTFVCASSIHIQTFDFIFPCRRTPIPIARTHVYIRIPACGRY